MNHPIATEDPDIAERKDTATAAPTIAYHPLLINQGFYAHVHLP